MTEEFRAWLGSDAATQQLSQALAHTKEDTMELTELSPEETARRYQINERCRDGFLWLEEFEQAFKRAFVYNPVLEKACEGMMEQMKEAHMRLSDRCPSLVGLDMGVVESCQCWRCTFCDETDPFDGDYR